MAKRRVRTQRRTFEKFVREEDQTAEDYARRGFNTQAKDEARHARFFRKRAKE